ncbi:hypothetical protein STANM309S_00324 [Streptomyces tanashiensis]
MGAGGLVELAEGDGPFACLVHRGEPALGVTGRDHDGAEGDPGVQFDRFGLDEPRVLDGAFGGGERLGAGVAEHAPAGRADQDGGVDGGRREALDEFLGTGDLGPAVAPAEVGLEAGHLGPEPGGAQRVVLVAVEEPERRAADLRGPLPLAAEPGGDGGLGEQVEVAQGGGVGVAAAGGVRVGVVDGAQGAACLGGDLVPELHGPFEEAELLGVGVALAGLDGGLEDGGEGLLRGVRVVPVRGEPGGPLMGADEAGVGLQGLGVAPVEAGAFAGQQVVADGLADERVAEAVAVAVGDGEQDVGADGGPERLDEFVLGEAGDGGEQSVLDGGAALGDDPGDPLGGLGERLDPHEQEVAQGVAELAGGAAGLVGDDEFLDEEGVAVGAFEDLFDESGVGFGGEDAGELAVHLGAGEAGEFDAADGAEPVEFGEEGAQRVAAVDVVGAVAGDDHDPAAAQGAQEVGEQVPGGGVGPVQVLQDEHDRTVGGEPFQEPYGQFEEPCGGVLVGGLVAAGVAEFGQQAGELALVAVGGGGGFSAYERR